MNECTLLYRLMSLSTRFATCCEKEFGPNDARTRHAQRGARRAVAAWYEECERELALTLPARLLRGATKESS